VEVEPEVRAWLAGLKDRDFGRVDFLVGLLAERAEDLGEPYARHRRSAKPSTGPLTTPSTER
jgi:hypothetical protein